MKLNGNKPGRRVSPKAEKPKATPKARKENASGAVAPAKRAAKSGGKTAVLVAAIALAVLLGATAGFGVYVSGVDTIFPNVTAEGVDIGGLTVAEAAEKLEAEGIADQGDLTVQLPLNVSFTIDRQQSGAAISAEALAQAAYDECSKGFFGSMLQYLECSLNGAEITTGEGSLDEEYLRGCISGGVLELNAAAMGSGMEVGEDTITVTKGVKSVRVDENALYDAVCAALLGGETRLEFAADVESEEELDLQSLYDMVYTEPVSAVYDPETYSATAHVTGVSFDLEAARALWESAESGETVTIPLVKTEPEFTTEGLNARLFADVLAQKTTTLTQEYNRNNNVTLAAKAMNGVILNPGETFSYNACLGQRTTAAGYLGAGAYMGGEVVTEVGGGICQGSSTLYYCTLYANLEIVERVCHWFGVSYVPVGLDATVSWGGPDFVFRNDRDYPIKIEAWTDLGASPTLTVKLLGTDVDGSYVKMTTEQWWGETTYGATSYRWVYAADGTLISSGRESSSTYHLHIEESPSPSPSESPSPSPSESPLPSESPAVSESPSPSPSESPAASQNPSSGTDIPAESTAPEPIAPVETPVPTPDAPVQE